VSCDEVRRRAALLVHPIARCHERKLDPQRHFRANGKQIINLEFMQCGVGYWRTDQVNDPTTRC
jgi:hypothetical protein